MPTVHRLSRRIELVMQRRPFAVAGAIVSFTAAVLAYYAPATVMHRNIGAVAPILRDNFWLAVHVVTIMASYASAAIALILGCVALGHYLFGRYRDESNMRRRPPEACRVLAGFIYTAIQITVLLLAAGTIIGALWADKPGGIFGVGIRKRSGRWFRYWCISSFFTSAPSSFACGLSAGRATSMAVAAVFGFTAILFTYYGVNFVLGSGMHSYGSGAGGLWAVASVTAIEWLFLLAAAVRHLAETSRLFSPMRSSSRTCPGEERGYPSDGFLTRQEIIMRHFTKLPALLCVLSVARGIAGGEEGFKPIFDGERFRAGRAIPDSGASKTARSPARPPPRIPPGTTRS